MMTLLCAVFGSVAAAEVTDVLTKELTGVTGTSYAEWSGLQVSSNAVYAGQSAGGNESIQLRSNNNNSGIVTTTSGGKVKSVTVSWNENTTAGRTLNIYGSNTAYANPTDLYGTNGGDLLGTIVNGTSTKLEIDGDYAYIGLRSASGAMYLTEISIVWETEGTVTPVAPKAPTFNPEGGTYYGTQYVSLACSTPGATIYYTLDNTTPKTSSTAYTGPIEIAKTTTIKAIAEKNGLTSEVASATYTIEEAETLPNIAALSAQKTAGNYEVKLNNAVVTYVNGNYAYIQDASGAIVMYKSGHGLTAGQTLTGTATVTYQLRNGNPQITALNGITPADGTAPEPTTVEASAWNTPIATVLSKYFKVTGATLTKSGNRYYVQLGDENVQLYGQGNANPVSAANLDITYTIIGFPTLYNSTVELQIFEQPIPEGAVKKEAGLTFGVNNFTAIIGEQNDFPVLSNPNGLTVTYSSSNEEVATVDANGAITLLKAGSTTIKAVSEENDNFLAGSASYQLVVKEKAIAGTDVYEPVADASTLVAGDQIIFVNEENTYALGTTQNTGNRSASDVALESDGTIIPSNQVQPITLEKGEGGWYFSVNDGYLYAASTTANQLKTQAAADEKALATIAIGSDGIATVQFNQWAEGARTLLRFNPNSGNPIFSCYATTSTIGTLVRVYRNTNAVTPKAPAGLSYSESTYTATIGKDNTFPTLDNPNKLAITYTSSDVAVATIDATGKVTLVGEGTTTITASSAETDAFKAGSASYTLKVETQMQDNSDKFLPVEDFSTLAAGDEIIFVGTNTITDEEENSITSYYGLGTNQKANNREGVAVTYNADGTITGNNKLQTITLEGEEDDWYFNVGNGYLYAASSSSNWLRTEAEADANASATITKTETETEEGVTTSTSIVFQGENARNVLQFNYNNGTPLFSCYATASQKEVKIYRKMSGQIRGDANGDGTVDVVDVMTCVDVVLKKTPKVFIFSNADLDNNNTIDVTDVMGIVNIILLKN